MSPCPEMSGQCDSGQNHGLSYLGAPSLQAISNMEKKRKEEKEAIRLAKDIYAFPCVRAFPNYAPLKEQSQYGTVRVRSLIDGNALLSPTSSAKNLRHGALVIAYRTAVTVRLLPN
ncbi:hypothetical protein PMAA_035080 [Talaromyces marneffei ATCC 18224]|uniref:Uncharacterized protein n=1 Tax=Talaromyces marneffei (strain ATCC 18224 / CBS 334.59 / QM 7333) TaxID=441960 RepID=B6Q747_TALMQ|nr:hypothetical protein PMAA_035080 [Talaromyces marneffei ATCC 18224]